MHARAVSIYALWDEVRRNAWAMLDEQTLGSLNTFWLAVLAVARAADNDIDYGEPDFRHFGNWVAARAGDGLHTGGWQHFCTFEPDPFGAFFRLLDDFRGRRLADVGLVSFDPPIEVPWTTQVQDGSGVWRQVLASRVSAASLADYGPHESCFLILTYESGEREERWMWTADRATKFLRETLGYHGVVSWGTLPTTSTKS